MYSHRSILFSGNNLSVHLETIKAQINRDIEQRYDINTDVDEFAEDILSKYKIELIELGDPSQLIPREIKLPGRHPIFNTYIEEDGIEVTIEITFSGAGKYLSYQPSSRSMGSDPDDSVDNHRKIINLFFRSKSLDTNRLNREIERVLNEIKINVAHLNNDLKKFNDWLDLNIKALIARRRQKITSIKSFAEKINIPIKRVDNPPPTIPIKRKKILMPSSPKVQKKVARTNPTIAESVYEDILELCFNMSLAMERNPTTFENLDEEQIRDFFLVILNAFFEGEATGETFNKKGKTDILIRHENQNIFIVECEIWHGEKYLLEKIDQLFGYITWRDTKTSIFIFNKEKDTNFTTVLGKIDDIMKKHNNFKSIYSFNNYKLKSEESIFGYIFIHPEDSERNIFLTVMSFNIPESE